MHELEQTISPGLVQVVRLDKVVEGVVALVGQVAAAARNRGCPALLRRHLQHLPAVRACNDEKVAGVLQGGSSSRHCRPVPVCRWISYTAPRRSSRVWGLGFRAARRKCLLRKAKATCQYGAGILAGGYEILAECPPLVRHAAVVQHFPPPPPATARAVFGERGQQVKMVSRSQADGRSWQRVDRSSALQESNSPPPPPPPAALRQRPARSCR